MKTTEEPADAHGDFAGDEATSVMGGELLSTLTERSRRIDVPAPLPPVPEPEISIVSDESAAEEAEPVTTMRPVKPMSPPARPQLLVVGEEYPALSDDESTMMMDEPEPTTLAIRSKADKPAPPLVPLPPPAPAAAAVVAAAPVVQPLPVASAPDPRWAAELAPRALATIRVAPLPAPDLLSTPEAAPKRSIGSRALSTLAALALLVAAWTLGLGHHDLLPTTAISPAAASAATSALVTPWGLQTRAQLTLGNVRTALASLVQWSPQAPRAPHAR